MTELETYIKSYFGVSENSLKNMALLFEETSLKRNDFFCQKNKPCSQLSFIKSGCLRVFNQTENKEVTQWVSMQGEFVTDLSSLIFNNPARWNIQAVTDCEFYTISKTNYADIAEHVPEWPTLEKLFLAKCFLTLEDRVYSFLSMSAEERYEMFINHKKQLFNQIPHHYIASMLGMTPETLSRIRKKSIS